jgi:DNA modification methylase
MVGDAIAELRKLPADSVDMCVTSPPYWGMRDYGVAGQMGLEPTLGEHLDMMVVVFEEVRRVLKPHGSLWLNYGDCYATAPNGRSAAETKAEGVDDRTFRDKPFSTVGPVYEQRPVSRQDGRRGRSGNLGNGGINGVNLPTGRIVAGGFLKPKDLCMIPNRLAIALQDAGWWVRSEIVWGKPNAMPDSSGVYRPSGAHEKIFLLTKSGDADVWRARDTGELSFEPDLTERCPLVTKPTEDGPRWAKLGSYYDAGAVAMPVSGNTNARVAKKVKLPDGWDTGAGGHGTHHRNGREAGKYIGIGQKAVPVGPHKNRSNESYMSAIVGEASQRLLRSYERDLSAIVPPEVWDIPTASFRDAHFATFPPALVVPCILAGSQKGGVVLDPFGGAGTTGLVADRLGRDSILIEISPDYAQMARDRMRRCFVPVESGLPELDRGPEGPLFGAEAA